MHPYTVAYRGVQRGKVPLRSFLSPKIGGFQGVDLPAGAKWKPGVSLALRLSLYYLRTLTRLDIPTNITYGMYHSYQFISAVPASVTV
jgi:hypothetical protein